jgi:hypothetical protein
VIAVPRAPTLPCPARTCERCGRTNYTEPSRSGEDPQRVVWKLEPACRSCSAKLGNDPETTPRPHRQRISRHLRQGRHWRNAALGSLRGIEDYTNKYKGEQVEVALFGGDYQDGVLTAYCLLDDVAHLELNGHILIPLQNIASLHCSSRCDAPEDHWPPRGLEEDDQPDEG